MELKLLTDIGMLLMVEKGIKSGICQAIAHYEKTNNKYMGEQYNSKQESCYNIYVMRTTCTVGVGAKATY